MPLLPCGSRVGFTPLSLKLFGSPPRRSPEVIYQGSDNLCDSLSGVRLPELAMLAGCARVVCRMGKGKLNDGGGREMEGCGPGSCVWQEESILPPHFWATFGAWFLPWPLWAVWGWPHCTLGPLDAPLVGRKAEEGADIHSVMLLCNDVFFFRLG